VHRSRAIGKRHSAHRIAWRVVRRRPMESAHERCERDSRRCGIVRWFNRRRSSRQPWDHAPGPGKPLPGATHPNRHRNRQRQSQREFRKPLLLVFDQGRCEGASGQAHGEVGAEPVEAVVPSISHLDERQVRKVRVLLVEERPDQGDLDGYFCRRLCPDRHGTLL